MYSFSEKDVKGIATGNVFLHLKRDFQVLEIGGIAQRFQEYNKIGIKAAYWSRPDLLDVSWRQKLKFSHNQIYEFDNQLNTSEFSYIFAHTDAVRKLSVNPKLGLNSTGDDYGFASILTSIEIKASYEYLKNTRIKARFFSGAYSALQDSINYNFGLSNGVDYNRENYLYSRDIDYSSTTNGLGGGFRGFEEIYSDQIITLNTSIGIPKIPFSFYYDGGLANANFHWGVGTTLHIIDDYFEVYFPITGTNYINNTPSDAKDFAKSIRVLIKIPLKSSNEIIWDKI